MSIVDLAAGLWAALIELLAQGLVYFHLLFSQWGLPGSWGLSIVAFTLVVRVLTFPLNWQQMKSSKAMQELQPRLREIQKQYPKDRQRQMEEQMRLYRERGVNPYLGCLPMVVQMPVWFALYQALFSLPSRYQDFAQPFLWIPNLALPEALLHLDKWPIIEGWPVLAVFTGASQWIMQKMMTPRTDDPQQKMMGQMMQFMPIMFVFFAFQVPAGLVVYWAASNVFGLVQQYFVTGWGSLVTEGSGDSLGVGGRAATASQRPAGAVSPRALGTQSIDPDNAKQAPSEAAPARSRRHRGRKRK